MVATHYSSAGRANRLRDAAQAMRERYRADTAREFPTSPIDAEMRAQATYSGALLAFLTMATGKLAERDALKIIADMEREARTLQLPESAFILHFVGKRIQERECLVRLQFCTRDGFWQASCDRRTIPGPWMAGATPDDAIRAALSRKQVDPSETDRFNVVWIADTDIPMCPRIYVETGKVGIHA
ncbi:hypothetical protein [Fimbriimonas ginsengisoli]|uniref:Uncharacterized protein n=1 Tax=Fimbriimonas ginsengisoli Gsoil 348 TaxID=661478 RepID=A0A068NJ25_FIMGI|nr:hypothetical protein [Fimbriimonas ginsengisoli]AIE83511.1 hypothetical protein OP10G_0143 [Fimbriimonas ginsengisoli Gsoil 348]